MYPGAERSRPKLILLLRLQNFNDPSPPPGFSTQKGTHIELYVHSLVPASFSMGRYSEKI